MSPPFEQVPLNDDEESPSASAKILGADRRPLQKWAKGTIAALALVTAAAVLLHGPSQRPGPMAEGIVGLAESTDCSGDTDDCSDTKCCKHKGYVCYEKNEHYANCNASCTPGNNTNDPEEHRTEWSCLALGPPACSDPHENCHQSKCCANAGHTCVVKNEHWASCKSSCTPGVDASDPEEHQTPWNCSALGGANCSNDTEDCRATRCCQHPGYTCYSKNEHFANCNATCTPGVHATDPEDHQTPWNCTVLGGFGIDPMPAPAPAPTPTPSAPA